MDQDFAIDQFITEAPTLRRFDGITTGVRIAVYEVRTQHAEVRLMYSRDQTVRREHDLGIDPMRATRVQHPCEYRARRMRRA